MRTRLEFKFQYWRKRRLELYVGRDILETGSSGDTSTSESVFIFIVAVGGLGNTSAGSVFLT